MLFCSRAGDYAQAERVYLDNLNITLKMAELCMD